MLLTSETKKKKSVFRKFGKTVRNGQGKQQKKIAKCMNKQFIARETSEWPVSVGRDAQYH